MKYDLKKIMHGKITAGTVSALQRHFTEHGYLLKQRKSMQSVLNEAKRQQT